MDILKCILSVLLLLLFNKNVQPQFEDYAHVCKELQMCARDAAV